MASQSFTLDLKAFAEKAMTNADLVVRKVTIDLSVGVVEKTPVGNPELWAANSIAKSYNDEVSAHNAALRNDPANLTKAGRLKPGRKLNDGMDIKAPAGYVGGRARANYQFSTKAPAQGVIDAVDPSGQGTIGKITSQVNATGAGGITYVINNLPYIDRLEKGWSKQAPAGMVGVTVAEFQRFVNKAAAEVKK